MYMFITEVRNLIPIQYTGHTHATCSFMCTDSHFVYVYTQGAKIALTHVKG